MNRAYGSTDAPPFDIQQKRWAHHLNLAEGATKEQIKAEGEKLTNAFVTALRLYLKQGQTAAVPKFEETQSAIHPEVIAF